MHKSFIPYLQHILDECNYIASVITEDVAKNIIPELIPQIKAVIEINHQS